MASAYSDSNVGQTTGIALTAAGGVADMRLCRATYYVKMESPAVAGLIFFVFRWTDRDGTSQVHTSAALAAASTARIGDVIPFWSEDAAGAGAYVAWEIVTVGLLGSGRYEYFVEVDDAAQGV